MKQFKNKLISAMKTKMTQTKILQITCIYTIETKKNIDSKKMNSKKLLRFKS